MLFDCIQHCTALHFFLLHCSELYNMQLTPLHHCSALKAASSLMLELPCSRVTSFATNYPALFDFAPNYPEIFNFALNYPVMFVLHWIILYTLICLILHQIILSCNFLGLSPLHTTLHDICKSLHFLQHSFIAFSKVTCSWHNSRGICLACTDLTNKFYGRT